MAKTIFKVPIPKQYPVVLVSIAKEVEGGNVRVFQVNNACVKGQVVFLRGGDADLGLTTSYEDLLSL